MKTFEELQEETTKVRDVLDDLFGCEYGGRLSALLWDLIEFAGWANAIVEESKNVGTYDAVQHERDKKELEEYKLYAKRLSSLADVGIAVEYMRKIYDIESKGDFDYYVNNERRMADNELRDQVNYFLEEFQQKGVEK